MSGEHLWPDWIAALLPSAVGLEYVEFKNTLKPKSVHTTKSFTRTRQGSPRTKKIKVVCQSCNSGWMGDLEEAAKPYLTPLILGHPVHLTSTSKRTIAEWVTLKVLVAEHASFAEFPAAWLEKSDVPAARGKWVLRRTDEGN